MIEAFEISTRDGVVLCGERRRAGPNWAILVHARHEDLDAWARVQTALGRLEFSVVRYDLRGHGGSEGDPSAELTAQDLACVVGSVRQEKCERLFVIAAGDSVWPALETAEAERCQGFIAIAPSGKNSELKSRLPMLAVVSSQDSRQETAGSVLARRTGWTVVVHIPGSDVGLALLEGSWAGNVQGYVVAFLAQLQGARVAENGRSAARLEQNALSVTPQPLRGRAIGGSRDVSQEKKEE